MIDSSKIENLFCIVLSFITPLGYDVVATLVNGHFSNIKFYKKRTLGQFAGALHRTS